MRMRGWLAIVIRGTAAVVLFAASSAGAQGLSADVSAGRVVYAPVSANVETTSLMGALRYDARSGGWVYGAAGVPLRSDLSWGGGGAGGRWTLAGADGRGVGLGVETGGHAFLYRDGVARVTGSGGAIDALPFVAMTSGAGRVELRGGWRGQALSTAGVTERRGVMEGGIRAGYGVSARVEADARWVRADGDLYPFLGGAFAYTGSPIHVWVNVGRWLSADLDAVSSGGGVGVNIGTRATLWVSAHYEAPDPLYWNAPRRSWRVGVTRHLPRTAGPRSAPRLEAGGIIIEVPVPEAPGGAVAIAGDFSKWAPMLMRLEGDVWRIRLPLAPGVYSYAFQAGGGQWFVPVTAPGRRDDGMGGYVAVLVVD